jgi:hypothetical protein
MIRIIAPRLLKTAAIVLPGVLLSAPVIAQAAQLVTNGSFENVGSATNSFQINQNTPTSNLPGWTTTSGYSFLVFPGQATVNLGNGIQLYTFPSTSPDGGNFVLQDGGYSTGTLKQTISGLTVGMAYDVNFYQASGQQNGYSGDTTEWWDVSLGGSMLQSAVMTTPSHGSVGWEAQSLSFVATATSEVLGFLAQGTPTGVPPFVGLDGVSVVAVAEPTTITLVVVGLLGLAAVRRRGRPAGGTPAGA